MEELGTLHAKLCACVCVCVWLEDRSVGLPTPLASVRNLPFSLLKAGETMEGGEFFGGGGVEAQDQIR